MLESLFGGLLGGLFRLAPEIVIETPSTDPVIKMPSTELVIEMASAGPV